MQRRLQLQALITIVSVGMMFSSCGNIDIVKRKYRPGFHVDLSKKRDKQKVAYASKAKDARKAEKATAMETKKATVSKNEIDDNLTASADFTPTTELTTNKEIKSRLKREMKTPEFKGLTFDRKMDRIKREVFKKPTTVGNNSWMRWVAFGTGIGSLAFGFFAFLFAILTAVFWTSFIWGAAVLAILLGAAAIVFYILYKNENGTDPKAKLGFIFGIIGAGLGVLAIILGAVFFTIFVLG